MYQRCTSVVWATFFILLTGAQVHGAGISVDAGLTPPEDRWILRNQLRYMTRKNDPTSMDRHTSIYKFPTVLAYGVTSDFSVMVRQAIQSRDMDMMGKSNKDTGLDDLFFLVKYKLFRENTSVYTFGMAATLGFEFPTGDEDFTSDTWDVMPGIYSSWRKGPLASDLQIAYKWNGFADRGENGLNPGNELHLDFAWSYQFSLTDDSSISLAPVLEFSYLNIAPDRRNGRNLSNTGENVVYVSPGLKFTRESFIIEALLQIPVWQDQKGSLPERGIGVIVGTRFLF